MEHVVLLDTDGSPMGSADKAEIHTADTPLHLAFSCYVFNATGKLLVSRRALGKLTWPGVWTNSFCGHPAPQENLEVAVHRRAEDELGTAVRDVQLALPDFRYRAIDDSGIVENEICPVFIAQIDGSAGFEPNPDEVAATSWSDPRSLAVAVREAPFAFSPWLRLQLPDVLAAIGVET